jgi:hypothetical protein
MVHLEIAKQDRWGEMLADRRSLDASHLALTSVRDGLFGVDAHLKRLEL